MQELDNFQAEFEENRRILEIWDLTGLEMPVVLSFQQ